MKKVKMLYTTGVLSLLLSVMLTMSCADLNGVSNNAHTIDYEYTNPNVNYDESESQTSAADTVGNYIGYDMTNDSYYGEFVCLYSSYDKSALSVEYDIDDRQRFDTVDLHCICYGDRSGDMVRIIAEFLSGQTVISGKTFAGVHIDEPQKELQYCLPLDNSADRLRVTVQARYYSAKGGSKTDCIRFDNLRLNLIDSSAETVITTETKILSNTDFDNQKIVDNTIDEDIDRINDNSVDCIIGKNIGDCTADTGSDMEAFIVNDSQTNNESYGENVGSGIALNNNNNCNNEVGTEPYENETNATNDINNDESNDSNNDKCIDNDVDTTESYCGQLNELRTDYAKASFTTDWIEVDGTGDMLLECEICCDGSGDYVRFIVEFSDSDKDGNPIDTQTLTGKLYQRSVITSYQKQISRPDCCTYVRVTIQAKYESKKGGSKSDVVKYDKLRIR